jgi:hypothetical protein
MKNYIVAILMLVTCGIAVAQTSQNAIVNFKDQSDSTYKLILQEDPNYPVQTPQEYRWMIMAYLSTDAKIDPLSETGAPTGDDYINPYETKLPGTIPGQVTYGLRIGPTEVGTPLAFGGSVVTPEHFGKYIYIRIFNAHKLEDATKYMVLSKPYLLTADGPQNVTIIPEYGWDMDPVWKSIKHAKTQHPCGDCTGGHGCP